ncbi:MAG: DUF1634 domain-containing protein [Armatimonadetes bacterium]|nr:DUF1634 domain-containing protein [Armatimonadota bacterium]MDE2205799.1 DUF1634 domain-containing protein [Armatimonadota bacterium]
MVEPPPNLSDGHAAAAAEPDEWTDYGIEQIIGNLLRAGVLLAAGVLLVGAVMYLVHHGLQSPEKYYFAKKFQPPPHALRTVAGVIGAAFHGSARGIMQLGLLLLIATPIARVMFSVYAFARERDRMYVVMTLIVLSILLFSLFSGKGGG